MLTLVNYFLELIMHVLYLGQIRVEIGRNFEEELSNDEESDSDESHSLHYWTPQQLKFEGWLGCACHTLQLVIHDGYQELTSYRRVQAAFSKAKAICTLSHKSSHFSYGLNAKIPEPNETR